MCCADKLGFILQRADLIQVNTPDMCIDEMYQNIPTSPPKKIILRASK